MIFSLSDYDVLYEYDIYVSYISNSHSEILNIKILEFLIN